MDYQRIIYEPGPVTRIIFNRPQFNNAISHPMYLEIEKAFDQAAVDDECRVIVLSGAGNHFCAGHDALSVGKSPEAAPVLDDGVPAAELRKRFASERDMWREYWIQHNWYISDMHDVKIRPHPKPTIAMVHGYCIFGGFGMAQCMDIIFATEDAAMIPAGFERKDLDWRKAAELAYEHRFMTGREAKENGLVQRTYPTFEILEQETLAYAERVASQPLSHLKNIKQLVLNARGLAGEYYGRAGLQRQNVPEAERNVNMYEGRGRARTPRAFASLKAKLESQGEPVPDYVNEALARAGARDDRAAWQKALHEPWRDADNIAKAEKLAQAWAEREKKEAEKRQAKEAKSRT